MVKEDGVVVEVYGRKPELLLGLGDAKGDGQKTKNPTGMTRSGVLTDFKLVGVTGFEPATPCSQGKCATKLRYTPKSCSTAFVH